VALTILELNGIKIAEIITETETEDRGLLFMEVYKQLNFGTQFYTSKLFKKMALEYGVPLIEGKA